MPEYKVMFEYNSRGTITIRNAKNVDVAEDKAQKRLDELLSLGGINAIADDPDVVMEDDEVEVVW